MEIHHLIEGWIWIHHIITTSHMLKGRSSNSPTDVHTHGGTSRISHEDVPAPVDPYRNTSHPSA
jgi:hypothetical protein